jgi:hypothetical protein
MLQDPHYSEEAQQPQHADEADAATDDDAPGAVTAQRTHPGALQHHIQATTSASVMGINMYVS